MDEKITPEERVEQIYREAKTSYLSRERRYALLQAAATLTAGQDFETALKTIEGSRWYEFAVAQAEALLSEIERHEKK